MEIHWLTAFLDTGAERFASRNQFWSTITAWELSPFRGESDEFATLEPARGDPVLRVQRIHDGDGGVHLDLHVDDVAACADRAVALGARVVAAGRHYVMKSPAGLSFCFVSNTGYRSPPHVGSAFPSQIDQVCIDIPPDAYAAERDFWSMLTSWNGRQSSYEEFFVLDAPSRIPVGLLLQRLGEDDRDLVARAHVDIAAGEHVSELAADHLEAGATLVAEFSDWVVLSDPAGYPYCITSSEVDFLDG